MKQPLKGVLEAQRNYIKKLDARLAVYEQLGTPEGIAEKLGVEIGGSEIKKEESESLSDKLLKMTV